MADNVQHPLTGTGTADVVQRTDDLGAAGHVPYVKLLVGTDGSAAVLPSDATAGLKVDLGADNDVTVTSGTITTVSTVSTVTNVVHVDDNAGSLTVDGTVTANLAAGTNNIGDVDVLTLPALPAGTNNIGDVDVLTIAAGDNNIGNVDIVTVPAPLSTAGGGTEATALRVTLASDSTGLVSVDDNGGALTVDNAGTFAVQSAQSGTWTVQPGNTANTTAWKVDGSAVTQPVSGTISVTGAVDTELTTADLDTGAGTDTRAVVGIVGSKSGGAQLIPGDATAGLKVDLGADNDVTVTSGAITATLTASALNIGDVDVLTLPALVAGSANIGDVDVLTVPAPLSTTGTGTEATALRVTIATDSTGVLSVDDNGGALTVDGTVAVTNAGTFATQVDGSALTALQLIDDPVATLGTTTYTEASTKGMIVGAVRRDADTTLVDTTNEVGPLQMSAAGALKVEIFDGGDSHTVDGTVTANLAAGTNNIGDVDILSIAAGDNNIGNVDVVTMPTVTVAGGAAHASPVSGNPNLVAGRASNAVPTDVGADGDAASLWTNRNGAQVIGFAPHVALTGSPWTLTSKTAQYTTTQTSAVLVAGGASEKLIVTSLQIQAGGTTAGTCQVYFGTGAYSRGTTIALFDGEFAPSSTLKPGVVMQGPFISATNGDDILVTTSAAINPLTVTVWYYVLT